MLERNPEAMNPEPLPGYVWLATPGKVLHAGAVRGRMQYAPRLAEVIQQVIATHEEHQQAGP